MQPRLRLIFSTILFALPTVAVAQPWAPGVVPPGGAPAVQVPTAPQVPFVLDAKQQAEVDTLLKAWEQQSSQIQTFAAEFTKFEYDATWAKPSADPNKPPDPIHVCLGELKFAKPDKGLYRITHMDGKIAEEGEHWVCDGKAIYAKEYRTKTVKEYRLPPQLQGKAISDGPMPFVFGVEAEKMKQRYWMRIITPEKVKGYVWLEAFPKHARDAENFRKLKVILTDKDLTPMALEVVKPNDIEDAFKVRDSYALREIKKNAMIDRFRDFVTGNFVAPPTPFGWKRVVEDPAAQNVAEAPAQPGAPAQAERPLTLPPRR